MVPQVRGGAVVAGHRRRGPGWLWLPVLVLVVAALGVYMLVRPGSSSVANPAAPATRTSALPTARVTAPPTAPATSTRGAAATPTAPPTAHAGSPVTARPVSRDAGVTGATGALIGGGGTAPAPAAGSAAAPAGAVGVTLFGLDSATVDPAGRQVLTRAAALIHASRPAVVTVTGYASRVGEPRDNLALSRRRAVAVAAVLHAELGTDTPLVDVVARGEAGQVADGTSVSAGTLDRRVVVTVRAAR